MSLNIRLIRASFEKAKPIADKVADRFYENLFNDYPQAKVFFKNTNMAKQKKQLMGGLVFIVDNLDNTEKLVQYLKSSGARHVNYGATESAHYEIVGKTLLKTLGEFFGDDWTPELKKQWTLAYGVIAETMIEGAKELSQSNVIPLHSQTFELPDSLKQLIRQKVSNAVRDSVQKEVDLAYEEEVLKIESEDVSKYIKKAS